MFWVFPPNFLSFDCNIFAFFCTGTFEIVSIFILPVYLKYNIMSRYLDKFKKE